MTRIRPRLESWLWLVQRAGAVVLLVGVAVHFTTNIMAVRNGLSAEEILGRTAGNMVFLIFYSLFSLAIAGHGAVGLRTLLREATPLPGAAIDGITLAVGILLAVVGCRIAYGFYAVGLPVGGAIAGQ